MPDDTRALRHGGAHPGGDDLAALLGDALHADLSSDRVDVPSLLDGSRRRARRVRSRRVATAAGAALLVVAVPTGFQVLDPQRGAVAPPAALLPGGDDGAGTDRPPATARTPDAATPSAVPAAPTATPGDSGAAQPGAVQPGAGQPGAGQPTDDLAKRTIRLIPDALAFTATELPAGVRPAGSSTAASPSLSAGMNCPRPRGFGVGSGSGSEDGSGSRAGSGIGRDSRDTTPVRSGGAIGLPLARREWVWTGLEPGDTRTDQATRITLTVTRWSGPAAGTAALTSATTYGDASTDGSNCGWSLEKQPGPAVRLGDQNWTATSAEAMPDGSLPVGAAAWVLVRVGDVIAGVEVQRPSVTDGAIDIALDLAEREAKRLAKVARPAG